MTNEPTISTLCDIFALVVVVVVIVVLVMLFPNDESI